MPPHRLQAGLRRIRTCIAQKSSDSKYWPLPDLLERWAPEGRLRRRLFRFRLGRSQFSYCSDRS